MIIKTTGDQINEIRYTAESIDSPIDPDWGEIGNYGSASEVGDIS